MLRTNNSLEVTCDEFRHWESDQSDLAMWGTLCAFTGMLCLFPQAKSDRVFVFYSLFLINNI